MEEISIQSEGCNLLRTESEKDKGLAWVSRAVGDFSSPGMNLHRQQWDRVDSNSHGNKVTQSVLIKLH